MQDVIVIGGSYAGLAAALQLARARRMVLLIDGGPRRNRFAGHSCGFVGQDGADPDNNETTVRGLFACGDVARAPHSVSLAVGDGAWAGAQLHRSLVWPE